MVNRMMLILLILSSITYSHAQTCQGPQASSFVIKSDTFLEIVNQNMIYLQQAVLCNPNNSLRGLLDSKCIWKDINYLSGTETVYFRVEFSINGVLSESTLKLAGDDSVIIELNGARATECDGGTHSNLITCNITSRLRAGKNTAIFTVTDYGGLGGLVFILTINTISS